MKQPFTVDDLYLHQKITGIHCTQAAGLAACTVRSVDRESNSYTSRIWGYGLDDKSVAQLTHGPGDDTTPQWSQQGDQLAFISTRGGTSQVYLLPRHGGEARQVGQFAGAVSNLRWTADGQTLVVAAAVPVDPDWRGERANGRRPAERDDSAPELGWRLPYKADGSGYVLSREIHLFALDVGSGETRQITDGPFDVMAFAVSPAGDDIAYVRTREGRFAHRTDLWRCTLAGTGHRRLTTDLAMVMQPVWSPDGKSIAFSGSEAEGDAQANLWLVDANSRVRMLGNASLCLSDPPSLHWEKDGQGLLFTEAHRGRHRIVKQRLDADMPEVLVDGDVQFGSFCPAGTKFVYSAEQPAQPCELYASDAQGGNRVALSDLNPWWRDRTPIKAESRKFSVPDGKGGEETIEGWLLRAEDRSGPYPLLNDVHGGPASYALLDFDTNVFWQVLCSRGWVILALNAVGSSSYGREFSDRVQGRWGELDLPQHMAAIEALRREGICDDRVTISGKSYGGYLSGWAIGHTDLFRAAVVMAPVGNIETHYGTSDGGYYADPLYMGTPGRFDRMKARKLSPMISVEKARTPTLFMQGKEDERCPKCQSEELFVSLMCAGDTPTELVLYPNEGHGFLGEGKPSVRCDAAQRIVDWVEKHVRHPVPDSDVAVIADDAALAASEQARS